MFRIVLAFFLASVAFVHAGTDEIPKVIVLIAASDSPSYFMGLQTAWRKYMRSEPEHVTAYFLKANKSLGTTEYAIIGDTIYTNVEDSSQPGVLLKTIASIKAVAALHEYDFLVRTYLSSFFHLGRLLQFLEKLPRRGIYYGRIGDHEGIRFAAGTGIYLSADVAAYLIQEVQKLSIDEMRRLPDDVIIGKLLQERLELNIAERTDLLTKEVFGLQWKQTLQVEGIFHWKLRNIGHQSHRHSHEVQMHRTMIAAVYQSSYRPYNVTPAATDPTAISSQLVLWC
jgi:hypothetical protein